MTGQDLRLSITDLVTVEEDKSWVNIISVGQYESVSLSFNREQIDQFINMLRAARRKARLYDIENLQS